VLAADKLQKSYDATKALDGVDLRLAQGEILALLGPNGAGKTTLISIIAGLLQPDGGRVWIDGVDVLRDPNRAQTRLGLAPQEIGVYPTISVRENLRFYGELSGLRKTSLEQKIAEISSAFELEPFLDRQARTLSGGEARQLHTAMALMNSPSLVLLDEATVGLDVHARGRILEVVKDLADRGAAVLYSTHYLQEVEDLGATVAIIDQGRIVAQGSLEDLVSAHGQPAVELSFRSSPPPLQRDRVEMVDDSTLRIQADGLPGVEAAELLSQLGDATEQLTAIKLIQPDLESVFLTVTGHRFDTSPEISH